MNDETRVAPAEGAESQGVPPEQAGGPSVATLAPTDAGQQAATDPSAAPVESAPAPQAPQSAEASPPPVSESAAPEGSPGPEAAAGDDRPSERIKIGTQREGPADEAASPADATLKPKPVNPVTTGEAQPTDTKAYPPPNARTAPTEEEEAELSRLMEGASVDQVLDSTEAAAPAELAAGTKMRGKVARVTGDSVFVDLGTHQQGVVPLKQFEAAAKPETTTEPKPPSEEAAADAPAADKPAEGAEAEATPSEPESFAPEEGAEIEVHVVGLNADEGYYDLTLPTGPQDIGDWDEVEVGKVVEVTITGKNKGGLECKVSGIRGFMPLGQISIYRVENPEEFVGQRLTAVITEANRSRKNVILSHRAVMERERAAKREQLLAELAPGQMRDGVVRSLRDFGAFVDLGGVDGMVHVSKLSWDRIGHPKEVLSEGQAIKVKIEKVDRESGKIALSYRESAANPWDSVEGDFPVGSTAKGKVSKIADFGAFVRLKPGVEGLIHISELDHKRVHRTSDVVSEGLEVETKVLSIDRQKQRIALSLKALSAPPPKPEKAKADEPAEDEPKRERKKFKNLKGGIGGPSGGEQFGLKW